jgi:secreted PhoX family phosphatase
MWPKAIAPTFCSDGAIRCSPTRPRSTRFSKAPQRSLSNSATTTITIAFFPLEDSGNRGLLCVNHEYTNEEIMFPDLVRQDTICFPDMTAELVEIEMAAHGVSIIEIMREDGKWRPVLNSKYNRRISPANTEMAVDGPAAGHDRMKTGADPAGTRISARSTIAPAA